jgi:hypothetical protein
MTGVGYHLCNRSERGAPRVFARAAGVTNGIERVPPHRGRQLASAQIRAYIGLMSGFIYFNITDHARLPARFFGMTRSVLARV